MAIGNSTPRPTHVGFGHTTGGKGEISDQVRAVPLEDRNCCEPLNRGRSSGEFVRLMKRKGQQHGDRRCQRLRLVLRCGGRDGRGDRRRRLASLHAARRSRATLEVAAGATATRFRHVPLRACVRSDREDALKRQDESQHKDDCRLHDSRCHDLGLVGLNRQSLRILPNTRHEGNISCVAPSVEYLASFGAGTAGKNAMLISS